MNHILSLVLLSSLAVSASAQRPGRTQEERATIMFDGSELEFPNNAQPFYIRQTAMVPLRVMAEKLNIYFQRSDSGNDLRLTNPDFQVRYRKGSGTFSVNGVTRNLGEESRERAGILFLDIQIFRAMGYRTLRAQRLDGNGGWDRNQQRRDDWGDGRPGNRPGQGRNRNDRNDMEAMDWQVTYRGRTSAFNGDEAIISRPGTAMVPARATARFVGARLDRSDSGRTIVIRLNDRTIEYRQGDRFLLLNRKRVTISRASEERNEQLFLPIEVFTTLTGNRLVLLRDTLR